MSRFLLSAIVVSILILNGCKNNDEKAQELGFKDYSEQQWALAKGFTTKAALDKHIHAENLRVAERLKQSTYCLRKSLQLMKFIMNFDGNNIDKALACNANLELFMEYYSRTFIDENDLGVDKRREIYNSLDGRLDFEISKLSTTGRITYGELKKWSNDSCETNISQKAVERARASVWCNPDLENTPFR